MEDARCPDCDVKVPIDYVDNGVMMVWHGICPKCGWAQVFGEPDESAKEERMKVRYKDTKIESVSSRFNTSALSEILLPDDSAFVSEMEVFVNGCWKDMRQAFKDKDIIPDNYHCRFGVPQNEDDRKRGYFNN